jgi:GTPase SAR1 family protein
MFPVLQLIVCGDQSSGKSSVLEAVSGVRFPTKDSLCTRFAAELTLRRGPATSANVVIAPGAERPEEEAERLSRFKAPTAKADEFPLLVEGQQKLWVSTQKTLVTMC